MAQNLYELTVERNKLLQSNDMLLQRIAELERELSEAATELDAAIEGAVEVRCKSNDQARAEERERIADMLKENGNAIINLSKLVRDPLDRKIAEDEGELIIEWSEKVRALGDE